MEKILFRYEKQIKIKSEQVIQYIPIQNYFKIITDANNEYYAEKIYDSRSNKQKQGELVQHFFGINITVNNNTFNENKLTLMDFTEENNVLHFMYILPFSHNKALVESTVFSKEVLDETWYRDKINDYLKLKKFLYFKEHSTEKGVIPMFFSEEKKIIKALYL